MVSKVEQASIEGDTDRAKEVIGDIRCHDAALAQALGALIDEYEYEIILSSIQKSRAAHDSGAQ